MRKIVREGFSLVELLIAMTISVIVLGSVITLLAYGAHNMNQTQTRVALQDQAKDATNHITSYAMEASDVSWDASSSVLTLVQNKIGADDKVESAETFYYWKSDEGVYFARESDGDPASIGADKKHLLVDHVKNFSCETKVNDDTGKRLLHVQLDLEDGDIAEFSAEKDISLRNQ